ncbi:MAG: glycosyltransferase family 4 protein [Thermoplasmata archaeon]
MVRGREIIKIAMIVWDMTMSGGTQRQALELARYLMRKGHTVDMFCHSLDEARCYPDLLKGLNVVAVDKNVPQGSGRRSLSRRWALYPLEPLFTREERELADMIPPGYDVLNPHEHRAYRVAHHYKRRHGTPAVWMVNDLPRSLRVPERGWTRKKLARTLHYCVLLGPLALYVDRGRMSSMDRSVVFDEPTARAFELRTGVKPDKMGSGLDISSFHFRKKTVRPGQKDVRLLAVGVYYPHRRFEDIVLALEALVRDGFDPSLTIVGSDRYDPGYSSRIKFLVDSKGMAARVRFLGEVSEAELRELYSSSEVFVFPNFPQTWGLAPFEAMASGTPAIVCGAAGAASVLKDGENALIVPPARPDMIAERVARLLTEPGLYDNLTDSGRMFVEENITWDAYGSRMEGLLEAVRRGPADGAPGPKL